MPFDKVPAPPPVRLRPATESRIGTTAFFRNRALLATLLDELAALGRANLQVLFHACSIGAEVYSFLIAARLDPRFDGIALSVAASDAEARFVEFAALGRYPASVLDGLTAAERDFFRPVGEGRVELLSELRQRVAWLPAGSFVGFETGERYDLVVLLNALLYVEAADQARTIERIGRYCSGLFVTSGFHGERIENDLRAAGFEPVTRNAEAIHEGWTDRRVATDGRELRPGLIFAPWSLPAFDREPGWEWRYGAIFRKAQA